MCVCVCVCGAGGAGGGSKDILNGFEAKKKDRRGGVVIKEKFKLCQFVFLLLFFFHPFF